MPVPSTSAVAKTFCICSGDLFEWSCTFILIWPSGNVGAVSGLCFKLSDIPRFICRPTLMIGLTSTASNGVEELWVSNHRQKLKLESESLQRRLPRGHRRLLMSICMSCFQGGPGLYQSCNGFLMSADLRTSPIHPQMPLCAKWVSGSCNKLLCILLFPERLCILGVTTNLREPWTRAGWGFQFWIFSYSCSEGTFNFPFSYSRIGTLRKSLSVHLSFSS